MESQTKVSCNCLKNLPVWLSMEPFVKDSASLIFNDLIDNNLMQ